MDQASARAAPAAPSLGTGHGRREESVVSQVAFKRERAQPNEVIRIRYDSHSNLVAMGVIHQPAAASEAARPVSELAAPGLRAGSLMPDGSSAIMPRMNSAATSDERSSPATQPATLPHSKQLYARHELPLWRFLLRQCRDRATAEELMQEVWFAVTREAPRFRSDGRFAPWLYTIARHRVIDRHRARASGAESRCHGGRG